MPFIDEVKLLFIVVIFATGVAGGLAPFRVKESANSKLQMARGNAFAGGIFLGAGLLHMLPDSAAAFAIVAPDIGYPLPALFAGLAILLVLLTDQIAKSNSQNDSASVDSAEIHSRPMLLFVVLSLHSMITGIALGLETAMMTTISLFIAIIAHKGAAAFALGTALASAKRKNNRRTIFIFAATTPLGILLGTVLSDGLSSNWAKGFEAIFDGLAAGTFLYVALMDIFIEAFRDGTGRWSKLFFAMAGFSLMALIVFWA